MNLDGSVIILFTIALTIIGYLLYLLTMEEQRPQKIKIYNEIPPPARFPTHWWGYGWRPWWRRYGGVPGFGPGKPLPDPQMPIAPKPIVISK